MQITVEEERENPFFKRKDLKLRLKHPTAATPSKAELVKELAAKYKVDSAQVIVDYILTEKGICESFAKVKILKEKPKIVKKPKKEEGEKKAEEKKKPKEVKEEKVEKKKEEKPKEVEKPKEKKAEEKKAEEVETKEKAKEKPKKMARTKEKVKEGEKVEAQASEAK